MNSKHTRSKRKMFESEEVFRPQISVKVAEKKTEPKKACEAQYHQVSQCSEKEASLNIKLPCQTNKNNFFECEFERKRQRKSVCQNSTVFRRKKTNQS